MLVMHERIKYLEGRLSLNSKNSSKPPSSDGLGKPAPKSLRKPGQNPNGGQNGHSGHTLRKSARVDEAIITKPISKANCTGCTALSPPL